MALEPLAPGPPASELAYRELKEAIYTGSLKSGERLVETELARMLQVSRTPIRMALTRLAGEGVVAARDGRGGGFVVANVATDAEDMFGLRERVEAYAARLASRRITADELAILDLNVERVRSATTKDDFELRGKLNSEFHSTITRASRNSRLVALVEEFYFYPINRNTSAYHDSAVTEIHRKHHEDIVAALHEGDGVRAEELMAEHIRSISRRMLEGLGGGE